MKYSTYRKGLPLGPSYKRFGPNILLWLYLQCNNKKDKTYMETFYHIPQIIIELVLLIILIVVLLSDIKTVIEIIFKGSEESSDEQKGDHTLQDEQK